MCVCVCFVSVSKVVADNKSVSSILWRIPDFLLMSYVQGAPCHALAFFLHVFHSLSVCVCLSVSISLTLFFSTCTMYFLYHIFLFFHHIVIFLKQFCLYLSQFLSVILSGCLFVSISFTLFFFTCSMHNLYDIFYFSLYCYISQTILSLSLYSKMSFFLTFFSLSSSFFHLAKLFFPFSLSALLIYIFHRQPFYGNSQLPNWPNSGIVLSFNFVPLLLE